MTYLFHVCSANFMIARLRVIYLYLKQVFIMGDISLNSDSQVVSFFLHISFLSLFQEVVKIYRTNNWNKNAWQTLDNHHCKFPKSLQAFIYV